MAKLFLVLFDILDRVADRRDLLCVLVGDLNIESLLELHDELYGTTSDSLTPSLSTMISTTFC